MIHSKLQEPTFKTSNHARIVLYSNGALFKRMDTLSGDTGAPSNSMGQMLAWYTSHPGFLLFPAAGRNLFNCKLHTAFSLSLQLSWYV